MATNKKAVLVTMYVEKPRRLLATNGHHHHHHHHHNHHVHHTIKREVIHYRHGDAGKRYINRRAELLQYSQRLRRTPARQPAFSPLISKQNSPNHQQTMSQALPVQRKARDERTPACFANCNAMVPNFFRLLASPQDKKERNKKNKKQHSGSTSNKIQAMMKSLEVKKKKGFISKLLSTFQKRR